jgi:hypothetical protein
MRRAGDESFGFVPGLLEIFFISINKNESLNVTLLRKLFR